MKKIIDERIRILIQNCVRLNHRALVLITGDRGLYQVANLHYMLSKARVKAQPTVLWCYKRELELSSHSKKRLKQIKKMEAKGNLDKEEINQVQLFMSSKELRCCYYKDTHKILGQTFGMCVLQDFESLTPNVLCRAMETVEGGGIIVMLFNTMTSLKQLYEITMDVHSRYRTEAHQIVEPRFNERFILSLGSCKTCLAIDDELNILPITQHINDIQEIKIPGSENVKDNSDAKQTVLDLYLTEEERQLRDLKQQLKDTKPIGNLVNKCKTLDQAKSVMQMVDAISEKNLKVTISLTAGRGRGKSAALGISIAGAIVYGFSNIFVTAPSPENLGTVFEFILAGLDAMNYKEHQDYEIMQSTNPDFNNAIIRINIFRDHRQTIQYVRPQDHAMLSQAELLIVDEAAAIPITLVKKLLGQYMVILSSTVHGYEGTGRSLSLKLISSLKEQNRVSMSYQRSSEDIMKRKLIEMQLNQPIRYGNDDPIEKFLNDLLCLDATKDIQGLSAGFPHPNECELYYVNRDTLFSYHQQTEKFLQKIMNIFVSSHYKNTPNDLQLLSDAPAHNVFVLLGNLEKTHSGELPDILCAIQVCYEGDINQQTINNHLKRGIRPAGDLIPWTVSEQFQDEGFASLSGARIVRIATHPNANGRGYGSRAVELLVKYFEGQLMDVDQLKTDEAKDLKNKGKKAEKAKEGKGLKEEKLKPKKHVQPILQKLSERKPVPLHYLGTSFGVTKELFMFWRKNSFVPIYLRQTANELTGEHTCVMLRPINLNDDSVKIPDTIKKMIKPLAQSEAEQDELPLEESTWVSSYYLDFKKRLLNLFGYEFRHLSCSLAFQFIGEKNKNQGQSEAPDNHEAIKSIKKEYLEQDISVFDLRRLDQYSKNMVDFHLIMDLVPTLAKLHFLRRTLPRGAVNLSYVQSAILIGMGLQFKKVEELQGDLGLNSNQILPLFNKMIRKFTKTIQEVFEISVEKELGEEQEKNQLENMKTGDGNGKIKQSLEDELDEEGKNMPFLKSVNASKLEFDQALVRLGNVKEVPSVLSVKRKRKMEDEEDQETENNTNQNKKRQRKH